MVEWLVPISLFWVMAAIFFGGMYDAEEGSSGGRQFLGLLLIFAVYVGIFGVLRMALGDFMGPLGRFIIPTALPTMLLGRIGKIVFGIVGVKMHRVQFGEDAH